MKLYLDSAKLEEIRFAHEVWDVDGLTTNPKHIQASGKPFYTVIREIAELLGGTDKPVSVEVDPHLTDYREIVRQGRELAELSRNFVIKVGMSEAGCRAMRELAGDGIRVNATLIFNVAQAWHAARAGASFISPFLGWREQFGDSAADLIREVRTMLDAHGYPAQIIAAAIRNSYQIGAAAVAGAHCITAGFAVYQESFQSPYTTMGDQVFQRAWSETPGS